MPTIFISFSTRDGKDIADHIYEDYKEKGYNVFYSPREIPYGHQWREEIRRHIEERDLFLVIATFRAVESQEVAKEIEEGKRLGKRMIPCRLKGIEWSRLKTLGIDLTQGPEFNNEYDLVRKLEIQLDREIESIPSQARQNYTRQHARGSLAPSNNEAPNLQTQYSNNEEVRALFRRAYALAEIRRYDEAVECYDKAIEINPKDAFAWYNKGNALANLAMHEKAIACFDKALELDPNYTNAWNNKGVSLDNLRKYRKAISC